MKPSLRILRLRHAAPIAITAMIAAYTLQATATDLLTSSEHTFYKEDNTRVGIEVEFTGLNLQKAISVVQSVVGGTVTTKIEKTPTTIKEIKKDGTRVYNEMISTDYIIHTKELGDLILKIDNNMISEDQKEIDIKDAVIEAVTMPIRAAQIPALQKVMDALKSAGALGTSKDRAVSIQMNTEIAEGKIENVDWTQIVNLIRNYASHEKQLDARLQVPANRRPYLAAFTDEFIAKISSRGYRVSARGLYDDLIYRQTLERAGSKKAWKLPIDEVRRRVLAMPNPAVGEVVKQARLRVSSLLMTAFPNDPMTKIYEESGWAKARPLIEWREFNNDFNIVGPFKQSIGLTQASKEFGAFDHDRLMYSLSGVDSKTIKALRLDARSKEKSGKPTIFRYFIGDPATVDQSEYEEMREAYGDTQVGFLPLGHHGKAPLVVPGESVVMHRLTPHQNSIVGKYNPTLINVNIAQALENKYVEGRFWNEYAPGVMPDTRLLSKLVDKKDDARTIVAKLNKTFPHGWVMKGVWDLGSEKKIVTDHLDIAAAVEDYLKGDFEAFRKKTESEYAKQSAAPEYVLTALKEHKDYFGWKIHEMLSQPDLAIVQNRVDIDREFRVEVVAGKVLGKGSTQDRWWYTYAYSGRLNEYVKPAEGTIEAIEAYTQAAIDKLPPELRNMTFGMDIATLKGGGMIMIESNPGGNSNFLYEEEVPSVKALTQRLKEFPADVKAGKVNLGLKPTEQMAFLRKKFAEWGVDTAKEYPGIEFASDHMIDPGFSSPVEPNPKFYAADRRSNKPTLKNSLGKVRCESSLN